MRQMVGWIVAGALGLAVFGAGLYWVTTAVLGPKTLPTGTTLPTDTADPVGGRWLGLASLSGQTYLVDFQAVGPVGAVRGDGLIATRLTRPERRMIAAGSAVPPQTDPRAQLATARFLLNSSGRGRAYAETSTLRRHLRDVERELMELRIDAELHENNTLMDARSSQILGERRDGHAILLKLQTGAVERGSGMAGEADRPAGADSGTDEPESGWEEARLAPLQALARVRRSVVRSEEAGGAVSGRAGRAVVLFCEPAVDALLGLWRLPEPYGAAFYVHIDPADTPEQRRRVRNAAILLAAAPGRTEPQPVVVVAGPAYGAAVLELAAEVPELFAAVVLVNAGLEQPTDRPHRSVPIGFLESAQLDAGAALAMRQLLQEETLSRRPAIHHLIAAYGELPGRLDAMLAWAAGLGK